jgi:hypothetical protein
VTLSRSGQVFSNKIVNGEMTITANNVTVNNVEVIPSAASGDQTDAPWGIKITGSNDVVKNTTIHGLDATNNAVEYGIQNFGSGTVASNVQMYWCTECYAGPGTLQNSYVIANGAYPAAHIEGTYWGGNGSGLHFAHDTILAPNNDKNADGSGHPTTAAIYAYGPDQNTVARNLVITNSLLAGGAYTVYAGGNTAVGVKVTNNRFSNVYFTHSGAFGVLGYYPSSIDWLANIWDGSAAPVNR